MRKLSFDDVMGIAAQVLSAISFILVGLMLLSSLIFFIINWETILGRRPTTAELIAASIQGLDEVNLVDLQDDVVALQQDVEGLTALPPDLAVRASVERLNRRMDTITERMRSFETLISDDPMEVLRASNLEMKMDGAEAQVERLENEMGRLYGQNGVFIGLIVTVILAQFGLFAVRSSARQRGAPEEK